MAKRKARHPENDAKITVSLCPWSKKEKKKEFVWLFFFQANSTFEQNKCAVKYRKSAR